MADPIDLGPSSGVDGVDGTGRGLSFCLYPFSVVASSEDQVALLLRCLVWNLAAYLAACLVSDPQVCLGWFPAFAAVVEAFEHCPCSDH